MDPQQLFIPEWLLNFIGRQAVLAELQRVQDAAAIAELRVRVEQLQGAGDNDALGAESSSEVDDSLEDSGA